MVQWRFLGSVRFFLQILINETNTVEFINIAELKIMKIKQTLIIFLTDKFQLAIASIIILTWYQILVYLVISLKLFPDKYYYKKTYI